MMIRIESFPSFVISKAQLESKRINAYGTEWYVKIGLYKYCQTSKKYIRVTSSSSDQPETLGAFLCGRRSDQKECLFIIDKTFKFKQDSADPEYWSSSSNKFVFNSTNHYHNSWGYFNLARINVIFTL